MQAKPFSGIYPLRCKNNKWLFFLRIFNAPPIQWKIGYNVEKSFCIHKFSDTQIVSTLGYSQPIFEPINRIVQKNKKNVENDFLMKSPNDTIEFFNSMKGIDFIFTNDCPGCVML